MLIDPDTGYIDPTVFDRLREQASAARSQAIAGAFSGFFASLRNRRRHPAVTAAAGGEGLRCGA